MERYAKLLKNNSAWVHDKLSQDPDYFRRHAEGQSPLFLWIGCADSRVTHDEITGTEAGEMFVHRNIANMVHHSDLNCMSVLEFGVLQLRVDHIIVCGHTHCGGVKAAMGNQRLGIIDQWIRPIKDVYHQHEDALEGLEDDKAVWDKLVDLNVRAQVMNLAKTSIVQQRWAEGEFPVLHGWVYRVEDGHVEDVALMTKHNTLDPIYAYDFSADD